jgi:hypothetical protein
MSEGDGRRVSGISTALYRSIRVKGVRSWVHHARVKERYAQRVEVINGAGDSMYER